MLKYWFLFSRGEIVLKEETATLCSIPLLEELSFVDDVSQAIELAPIHNHSCMALELAADVHLELPEGFKAVKLRSSYYCLDAESYQLAGKAAELLNWHAGTRFCGNCGAPLQFNSNISKVCPSCHRETWPKLSPAIIVLIRRGDEILLVQSLSFKSNFYGLVAGFVETGESLEDCVHREVFEETHLKITNLKYFNSQPWPYPRGLMAGFTADYLSGDLQLQHSELRKGGWFRRDSLPQLPEKLSMARQLIDNWLQSEIVS